jgi:hypothetical protein
MTVSLGAWTKGMAGKHFNFFKENKALILKLYSHTWDKYGITAYIIYSIKWKEQ